MIRSGPYDRPRLLAAALAATLLCAPAHSGSLPAAAPPPASAPLEGAAVARLEGEVLRLRTMRFVLEDKRVDTVLERIADARLEVELDPQLLQRAALPLLDLVGAWIDAQETPGRTTDEERVVDAALDALRSKLSSDLSKWMAAELLPVQSVPIERRRAVARIFRDRPAPVAKLSLALSAREADRDLARLSLEALAGWNDDLVHATFLEQAEAARGDDRLARLELVEKHFGAVRLQAGSRLAQRLAALVRERLLQSDWKDASRAVAWSRALDDKDCVAFLVAALDTWQERGERGLQSLRLRHELARALAQRSGQPPVLDAAVWRAWWTSVTAGLRPAPSSARAQGTQAAFFGVTPDSDRIVFVLDRSGSMDAQFAPGSARRWDEAQKQLYAFLAEAPKGLKYDVVLFHDYAESFKGALVANDPASLDELRLWLGIHRPGGATMLHAGVRAALGSDDRPESKAARLPECDTLVLLCDGETSEGTAWVRSFLTELVPALRLVVHGVQVGGISDGVLEELAKGSRGGFVKVGSDSGK